MRSFITTTTVAVAAAMMVMLMTPQTGQATNPPSTDWSTVTAPVAAPVPAPVASAPVASAPVASAPVASAPVAPSVPVAAPVKSPIAPADAPSRQSETLSPTSPTQPGQTSKPTKAPSPAPTMPVKLARNDTKNVRRCGKAEHDAFLDCQHSRNDDLDTLLENGRRSGEIHAPEFWCRNVTAHVRAAVRCIPPCVNVHSAFYGTQFTKDTCETKCGAKFTEHSCPQCDTVIDDEVDHMLEEKYEAEIKAVTSSASAMHSAEGMAMTMAVAVMMTGMVVMG